MTDPHLADLRKTYAQRTLSDADVLPDAVQQFRVWLEEAIAAHDPGESHQRTAGRVGLVETT